MRDDYEEPEEAEDGDAETEATVSCPHCGESVEITLDPSGGDVQEYIEDCEVCCNPWTVRVQFGADGHADVEVTALDE
ncbi:MAG: CPXCG motif-containing cysteine-rich protein [Gemmatimonadaceae bacterium]|nr:CPXCG motif-containing cysteine-rich protein [Gemmatimonadaceae bacterium]